MILADLKIDGKPRKVILRAPKNGFFFVIDRTDGKFISAKNFVDVNWATGYDANGKPIEVPAARGDEPYDAVPGPYGAHNWHPMSFNPETGLVYLSAQNVPLNLTPEKTLTQNAPTIWCFRARPTAASSATMQPWARRYGRRLPALA
jgi:quinohemoprotein ethanol dehydrogenase